MKSIKAKAKINIIEFPKLMISIETGLIVLATGCSGFKYVGTVVYRDTNKCCIGEHSKEWSKERFEDYNGLITLSNE